MSHRVIGTACCVMLLFGLGCTSNEPEQRFASNLTSGERVLVRLAPSADGILEATGIDAEDNNVDCEDGLTPDGQWCDGGPDANQDDGDEDDGEVDGDDVECEDGLTPDGQECDGGPDANQDDGDEDDGEEDDTPPPMDMVVAPLGETVSGASLEVLGLDVLLPAGQGALQPATYRFSGRYLGQDRLQAEAVTTSATPTYRILGLIQDVAHLPDGTVVLRLLDRDVIASPELGIRIRSSLDTDAEEDTDGVQCEQEGEHEGENEGCN